MTGHENCKHSDTDEHITMCDKVRAQVAGFNALTDEELSAAMRNGTSVTGWAVYEHPSFGVKLREITGQLDYHEVNREGNRVWRIRFLVERRRALYSSSSYRTGKIRLAD